jgi:hypothetical protein
MSVITDLTKNVDVRPFYAVVGATDLTVEKAREAAVAADKARVSVRAEFDKMVADLAPAKVSERVQSGAAAAFTQVQELPSAAAAQGKTNVEKVVAGYEDLALRGKKLVERIRNQKATKDLVAQAETTVAQAKGAVTTARKAAADVERSTKATVTTARKEAVKAAEAIAASVTDEVTASAKGVRTTAKKTAAKVEKATLAAAEKVGD